MDRQKIVTFGEIMLRLTPPDYLRFNQTNLFRASYGGSEANVAVSLANYGLQSEFVTRLPDNRVADACIDDLRRYGVRTDAILRGGKRLGIYYMEEAAACDRVIVMDDGHVLMDDVPRKVFSHVAELRQVGLDVPQTTELMTILKEAGLPVQADIIDEQECVEALEALLTR
mgnify:CR=1 FL=1